MTNRFMMSVAAVALIAGTGFASAQGTMGREGSSAGSTAQQSAPSAGTSSHEATKPSSGMKSTQSEQKSPTAGKNERAEDNLQGQKSKNMSSDNDRTKGGKEMKAEGREDRNATKAEGREDRSKGMKAEGREDRNGMKAEGREDRSKGMKAEGREDRNGMKAEGREDRNETRSQTTTGQAGAGAKLSTEQRTKITSVIREQHVAPINNVNFSISVGTRVPREVSFHPLPAQIVTIYPEWRGYEYFLVRDQIVVVDPRTLEIVAVLEA
ncbi:MAG TPA: DUF1236 domain-containing protein [Bradyrhizobium sp.]|nr:DUF1236 domain-containing protein [Bradyrhizobium sp.]